MNFLNLTVRDFLDLIYKCDLEESDMLKYIRANSNNDLDYLELLKKDAQDLNDYYDNVYEENLYQEAKQKIRSDIEKGIEPTIAYEKKALTERLPEVLNGLRLIEGWKDKNPDEKRALNKEIHEKIVKESPGDFSIDPKLSSTYLYNWDTCYLKKLIRLLEIEIDKVKGLNSDTESLLKNRLNFKISDKNKTDFIKIISAMYDCRMFETTEGKYVSNKQYLMENLGYFFNTDLKAYSTFLSKAKSSSSNYLDIFDKLKDQAEKYYEK